ncbi:hypothetical protein GOP47_0015375 [Adiantum capillus-veneris]|uniref:Uncharacterized protein n=1 Tax=Adiantum capillus-veneris TaxID=13818 RepID=A0A9D4UK97_ADICA|nr:hypothetical protein GOP47_0015375 [Adiantum capillus-veneris]
MEVSSTPRHLKHCSCSSVNLQAEGGLFYTRAYFDGECQASPLVYDLDRNLWAGLEVTPAAMFSLLGHEGRVGPVCVTPSQLCSSIQTFGEDSHFS